MANAMLLYFKSIENMLFICYNAKMGLNKTKGEVWILSKR